jgi:rhodanese-related sulfurtransferase
MPIGEVRARLCARREIALVDLREEASFARSHPLFAVQLSAGRLELDAPWRLPRREVPIALYDDGEGLVEPCAQRLQAMGWTAVHRLEGGLAGWRESGGELFCDVNVPSKAFGELVAHELGTPSLSAEELSALIARGEDVVVLDARRVDEYQTMSIPTGISVPGAELALRIRDLAPDPTTRVVVHCAGRTRSIIGTQSLVNAGIANPVHALRNGTIGWMLAGFALEHAQQRQYGPATESSRRAAASAAQRLADRAGALRLDAAALARWEADPDRTLYRWDVRSPEEYASGHLPGFGSAPGGQLVQETDVYAAVRGARIALCDGGPAADGTRAAMTAHWLAQLGWEVGWLTDADPSRFVETGPWRPERMPAPAVPRMDVGTLAQALSRGEVAVTDVGTHTDYLKGHLPGAPTDRYRRPYEGTHNPRAAMQAYLDWEYGLVAQLERDGTHGFSVLRPEAD